MAAVDKSRANDGVSENVEAMAQAAMEAAMKDPEKMEALARQIVATSPPMTPPEPVFVRFIDVSRHRVSEARSDAGVWMAVYPGSISEFARLVNNTLALWYDSKAVWWVMYLDCPGRPLVPLWSRIGAASAMSDAFTVPTDAGIVVAYVALPVQSPGTPAPSDAETTALWGVYRDLHMAAFPMLGVGHCPETYAGSPAEIEARAVNYLTARVTAMQQKHGAARTQGGAGKVGASESKEPAHSSRSAGAVVAEPTAYAPAGPASGLKPPRKQKKASARSEAGETSLGVAAAKEADSIPE